MSYDWFDLKCDISGILKESQHNVRVERLSREGALSQQCVVVTWYRHPHPVVRSRLRARRQSLSSTANSSFILPFAKPSTEHQSSPPSSIMNVKLASATIMSAAIVCALADTQVTPVRCNHPCPTTGQRWNVAHQACYRNNPNDHDCCKFCQPEDAFDR